MIVTRLHRYMTVQTLKGLGAALTVVGAIIILVDFVEQSRAVGTRVEVSADQLLLLTLLKAPSLLETTLPFIFLFGVLATLFRLNRRNELIVMRASGVSAWRILAAPIALALIGGTAAAIGLNPLGAALNAEFESRRDGLMSIGTEPVATEETGEPIWLREITVDGFRVIAAEALEEDARLLRNPSFFVYTTGENGAPRFDERIDAEQAGLQEGFWELDSAIQRRPGEREVDLGDVSLNTSIDRQALFERSRSPSGVSFWDLPALITGAREAGLASQRYELRWHGLLATPLTLLAATLIAAAATLRLQRLGGAAAFAVFGGAAGFGMFFLREVLVSLGQTGALPAATAAWSAPALTALIALIYIVSTEDG